jgi:hypothetical protein
MATEEKIKKLKKLINKLNIDFELVVLICVLGVFSFFAFGTIYNIIYIVVRILK